MFRSKFDGLYGGDRLLPSQKSVIVTAIRFSASEAISEEEEENCKPTPNPGRRSRTASTQNKRRVIIPRIQTTLLSRRPSATSQISSTTIATTTDVQPHGTPLTEKRLKQQLKEVYVALSHLEDERERIAGEQAAAEDGSSLGAEACARRRPDGDIGRHKI